MPLIFSTLAAAAGTIGTGTLLAGGGAVAAKGAAGAKKEAQKKKETLLAAKGEGIKAGEFAAGAPGRAKEAARAETDRLRRLRALSGGRTILTSTPGVAGKTVLG